eukprot:TRINITY_DN32900_c0_g1_i2.p1 TRINITY_DN32900_c0_g1~~TRINITY_DN32900_c0_g1_i2.p1  ORF type:complete len:483 (+),score=117.12 TRINITY_DN32900_c0_g1_i2:77-1525(+)
MGAQDTSPWWGVADVVVGVLSFQCAKGAVPVLRVHSTCLERMMEEYEEARQLLVQCAREASTRARALTGQWQLHPQQRVALEGKLLAYAALRREALSQYMAAQLELAGRAEWAVRDLLLAVEEALGGVEARPGPEQAGPPDAKRPRLDGHPPAARGPPATRYYGELAFAVCLMDKGSTARIAAQLTGLVKRQPVCADPDQEGMMVQHIFRTAMHLCQRPADRCSAALAKVLELYLALVAHHAGSGFCSRPLAALMVNKLLSVTATLCTPSAFNMVAAATTPDALAVRALQRVFEHAPPADSLRLLVDAFKDGAADPARAQLCALLEPGVALWLRTKVEGWSHQPAAVRECVLLLGSLFASGDAALRPVAERAAVQALDALCAAHFEAAEAAVADLGEPGREVLRRRVTLMRPTRIEALVGTVRSGLSGLRSMLRSVDEADPGDGRGPLPQGWCWGKQSGTDERVFHNLRHRYSTREDPRPPP